MTKKTKQPTLVRTPFGSYVLKKNEMPEACAACKKDELRDLIYAILDALPEHFVTDYAVEKLNLTTHEAALEAEAGAEEYRREGYEG